MYELNRELWLKAVLEANADKDTMLTKSTTFRVLDIAKHGIETMTRYDIPKVGMFYPYLEQINKEEAEKLKSFISENFQ